MRYFDFCILIVAFVVQLKNNSIHSEMKISSRKWFFPPPRPYQPICDESYSNKYKYYYNVPNWWEMFESLQFLSYDDRDSGDDSPEFMQHYRGVSTTGVTLKCASGQNFCNFSDGDGPYEFQEHLYNNVGRKRMSQRGLQKPFYTMLDTYRYFHFDWATDGCYSIRRVVNGWNLQSIEQLPYIVFVDSGCGGTIIGDNWVLTAGHCTDQLAPTYVYAGSLDLLGGCRYGISRIYVHPQYSRQELRYDIALLAIIPSFAYSPAIKPIMLSNESPRWGACGIVAGWGAEKYMEPLTTNLLVTRIPVVPSWYCRMFAIGSGQFCAGYKDARTDACQGDSGGPFVVNNYLVGIVSYGYKCALPGYPGVYVDVYYHRPWIFSISGI